MESIADSCTWSCHSRCRKVPHPSDCSHTYLSQLNYDLMYIVLHLHYTKQRAQFIHNHLHSLCKITAQSKLGTGTKSSWVKEYHNHEEEDSPSISNDMVGMLKSSPNRLLVVVLKRATEFDCRRCISARIISCQSGDLRCTLTGWSEVIWPSYSSACSAIWPLLNVTSISPSTNLQETSMSVVRLSH